MLRLLLEPVDLLLVPLVLPPPPRDPLLLVLLARDLRLALLLLLVPPLASCRRVCPLTCSLLWSSKP